MADFRSILDMPAAEVERPKPIPTGTYRVVFRSHEVGPAGKNQNLRARYTCVLTGEYREDVDQDQLDAFGGAAKLMGKRVNFDYWLTEDALFRFKDDCRNVFKLDLEGKTIRQLLSEVETHECWATLEHNLNPKDQESVYVNVAGIAAIED